MACMKIRSDLLVSVPQRRKRAEVAVARRPEAQAGEGELGWLPGVRRVVHRVLHLVLERAPSDSPAADMGRREKGARGDYPGEHPAQGHIK